MRCAPASGIAGVEQPQQVRAASVVEALIGLGEQPPGPVERVVLVIPMAEGLVLHVPTALVEPLVGELD